MEPGRRAEVVNIIGWALYALLMPVAFFEFTTRPATRAFTRTRRSPR